MGEDAGMEDDGIGWTGPPCPACGYEMNAETVQAWRGLKIIQRCPECDLVLVVRGPFGE